MQIIKCRNCVLFDKCPSGQRCVEVVEDFRRLCPVGKEKENESIS